MGAGLILEGGRWVTQEEVMKALENGDMETFHPFYQDAARPVYNFILSLTRSPEEAEDVVQDTYLTVWTKAGSYVPQDRPLAWVLAIARSLCCMRFREQKMRADVALEDLAERKEGEYCAPLKQAAGRKMLLDALGRISRKERQIILLHTAAGMKRRGVAEALQMPLATVLSKYNRFMKKLQELLRCSG